MQKMKKKMMKVLFALALAFAGFGTVYSNADAEDIAVKDGVKYTMDANGDVTIVGYEGDGGEVNLTSLFEDEETYTTTNDIVKIADAAFEANKKITGIDIPDTCTEIGASAFQGCTNLQSMEFGWNGPNTLTIGDSAFEGCTQLSGLMLADTCNLSIGGRAFYNCKKLWNISGSLTLPEGTTTIGDEAFYGCSLFDAVEIPDTVTVIGSGAFEKCSNVTSFKISGNAELTIIGDKAFYGTDLARYTGEDEAVAITIPKNCTSIGKEAFALKEGNIETVILNGDVTIGQNAFGEENEERENPTDIILKGKSTYTNAIDYATAAGESVKYQVNSSSITVNSDDAKTVYTYKRGQLLTIVPTGLQVMATYKEDSKEHEIAVGDCVISEIVEDKIGPQEITVSYGGATATYTIYVCYDMKDLDVTVKEGSYVYNGEEVKAAVTILKDHNKLSDKENLGENMIVPSSVVPYVLSYENNVNAYEGELDAQVSSVIPTVTVTGDNQYITGTESLYYHIQKADLDNKDVTVTFDPKSVEYSGEEQKPAYTLSYKGKAIKDSDNYTAVYTDNINAGSAGVTITAGEDAVNFKGSKSATFTITPYPLNAEMVTIEHQKYTGVASEPKGITIIHKAAKNLELVNGTDYTVVKDSYVKNISVGEHTVQIEGKGNYSGTVEASYEIEPMELTDQSITVEVSEEKEYTGKTLKPDVTVTQRVEEKEITLKENIDYSVTIAAKDEAGDSEDAPKNIAAYTVTVEGMGNYTESVDKKYEITSINVNKATVSDVEESYAFTGEEIIPEAMTVAIGDTALHEGTDYTVTYENNVEPGEATYTITGKGIYGGTKTGTFIVLGRPLFVENAKDNAVIGDIEQQIYNGGQAITPDVTVTKKVGEEEKILEKDVDYTVAYSNNTSVGTATISITGIDQYSGTMEKEFEIVPYDVEDCDVTVSSKEEVYTGLEITPEVEVVQNITKKKAVTLQKDTDYTVTYKDNVAAGTATITVEGKGNYEGSVTKEFTIVAYALKDCKVSLASQTEQYTGSAVTPVVNATHKKSENDTYTLVKDTDFVVTYANNTNAGTATATVTGKGNYTGTVTLQFTITIPVPVTPPVQTQNPSTPAPVQQTPAASENAVGTVVTSSNAQYKITAQAGNATGTVAFVKSIQDKKKLTSLTIPASITIDGKTYNVTAIEKNACKKYAKLKKVVIGKNVKSVGANAFAGCKALKNVKIQTTLLTKKTIGKKAFSGIHKKAVIKVPTKKIKEYQKALYGKGTSKSVKIK